MSPAMLAVLSACDSSPDGILRVADLVDQRCAHGQALGVARASLSRTLRRLWRAGLIELSGSACRQTQPTFLTLPESARSEPGPQAFALLSVRELRTIYRPEPDDPGFVAPRERARKQADYYRARAESDETYHEVQEFLTSYHLKPYENREAYRAAQLARVNHGVVRAHWVLITDAGRRLTSAHGQKLTGGTNGTPP